jgi:hypothetical protein
LKEQGPVLVVDAGGWGAGGIYDEDSDGDPRRDMLRTKLMANAMIAMGYDVVSASPQESASLISGPRSSSGIVEHRVGSAGNTVSITVEQRVPQPDQMLLSTSTSLPPPDAAQMKAPRVILSRLGEEESSALAAGLNEEALVINAGKKLSQRVSWRAENAIVANFDFQAKHLGIAEIYAVDPASNAGRKFDIRVRMEPLSAEIPDDPTIANLLLPNLAALKKKTKSRVEIEFWTMPECPGCAQARPEIRRLVADLSERAKISVRFVTHKEDGKLASLHGPRELQEAHVQAVIQKYYPEKLWDWMDWREQNADVPWQEGAKKFGMLAARINGAINASAARSQAPRRS